MKQYLFLTLQIVATVLLQQIFYSSGRLSLLVVVFCKNAF